MDGRNKASDDAGEHLTTFAALQRRVPSIVKRVNADQGLALRAAANPLLALAEMGYTMTPELEREVALRVRFDQPTIAKLDALTTRIHTLAGKTFDVDSPTQLSRVLFEHLKLPPLPAAAQRVVVAEGTLAAQSVSRPTESVRLNPIDIPYRPVGGVAPPDALEALKGKHPVIAPLLEYRAIQASVPPLAPRELYDRIARGDVNMPKFKLRATLRRGPTPE
ncbi:MAG: hypothetical protein M3081_00670 [Gemmatimonadota bacterium]|nr:hypothetical protein [Gemmatimonadota bacterium]